MPKTLLGITEIKLLLNSWLIYLHSFNPAIFAKAYPSLVSSRGPLKEDSLIGCGASLGYIQEDPIKTNFLRYCLMQKI